MFSIGELSKRTGVKVPTIRYYEQMGLIPEPDRNAGNQRRYDQEGLDRLGFIKHGRDLGLALEAIRELILLQDSGGAAHEDSHRIAAEHLGDIRGRIARLHLLEQELVRIQASCDGGPDHCCNILRAFGDHSQCAGSH
jgi:DNA-binding transcriptional MerR regulator